MNGMIPSISIKNFIKGLFSFRFPYLMTLIDTQISMTLKTIVIYIRTLTMEGERIMANLNLFCLLLTSFYHKNPL